MIKLSKIVKQIIKEYRDEPVRGHKAQMARPKLKQDQSDQQFPEPKPTWSPKPLSDKEMAAQDAKFTIHNDDDPRTVLYKLVMQQGLFVSRGNNKGAEEKEREIEQAAKHYGFVYPNGEPNLDFIVPASNFEDPYPGGSVSKGGRGSAEGTIRLNKVPFNPFAKTKA